MTPDERERMHMLCERIATAEDPDRFVGLLRELNEPLDQKRQRLEHIATQTKMNTP